MARTQKVSKRDGYANAFLPGSFGGVNYRARSRTGGALMDHGSLGLMYMLNGFARIVCDVPAEEMTRAGFEIDGLTPEAVDSIKSKLEELNASRHFNDALKWRRAYGGSLIVLGINDGNDLTKPLNEESISDVEFMRVYNASECYPESRYANPQEANYGNIELWKIQPTDSMQPYVVHESRVLVFDGESVPNDIRYSNQGWGASILQNCRAELMRLDSAYKLALMLMERMQQAIHGIPNLSNQIDTPEGEKSIQKRIAIVDAVRGALNTIVIDAEETYDIKSLSLTGVEEMIDRFAEAVSAVTRIPVYVLMTRSPGGLNATGATNQDAWNAQIEAWQNDQYRKPLDRLISLIHRDDTEGESDGGKYTIEFNPLSTPSESVQADIEVKEKQAQKTEMETLTGYINAGIITQDEVREAIREEYELEGDAPEPEEETPEPMVLNPGQKIVDPTPGQFNPAPVGTKK